MTIAAVYVTLSRLEAKDYVSSEVGESRPAGGGRARKEFCIETPGLEALRRPGSGSCCCGPYCLPT